MASKQRQRAATTSLALLAVMTGILVLLNVLGAFVYGRLDLTETAAFSLSEGSKRVVRSLGDRMGITLYFTPDLPPPHNTTERYVRDLLAEYEAASDGNIVLHVVHPDSEEERERAQQDGIQKDRIQAVVNDTPTFIDAYQGLVIEYLGEKKVVSPIRSTVGLEYTLTQTMKELVGDKRTIGILMGHGSPSPQEGLKRLQALLPNYTLASVSGEAPIDDGLAALLVVAPADILTEQELRHIDQYLLRGGSVGIFGGSMLVDARSFEGLSAQPVDTNINQLLAKWGVRIRADIVADAQCSRMPSGGAMGMQVMIPFPPTPLVVFSSEQREHAVTFRLDNAVLPFTSSLEILPMADPEVRVTPLASSTEQSWRLTGSTISLRPRAPQQWVPSGEMGPFTLLAAIEGTLPSAFAEAALMSTAAGGDGSGGELERARTPVRVLVSGTGMVLRDELVPTKEQLRGRPLTGTVALLLNAMDWLTQDSDLIAVRAKTVEDPALEVPAAVAAAEEEALAAAERIREAAQRGDQATAADAVTSQDEALKRHAAAMESWKRKKDAYRWLHTLGIPLLLVLFGLARWRLRLTKKQRLTL
jgi:ABC-2 type transport system permease protein